MENCNDVPTPAPDPVPLKGCDYLPPETTSKPQSIDDPLAGPPPGSFDPNAYPPGNGAPQR